MSILEVELLIFDWDGTLADSLAIITISHKQAAKQLGLPIPDDELIKSFIGLSSEEVVKALYPHYTQEPHQLHFAYRVHLFLLPQMGYTQVPEPA